MKAPAMTDARKPMSAEELALAVIAYGKLYVDKAAALIRQDREDVRRQALEEAARELNYISPPTKANFQNAIRQLAEREGC